MNVDHTINKTEFKKAVIYNLKISYRRTIEDATAAQMYQAVALAVKDMIIDRWIATHKEYEKQDAKVVYYMSMEFLTGRFLGNNIISLCEQEEIREALSEMGFDFWPPASWTPWLPWAIRPMAAGSVTATVCLSRRSRTATRSRCRTNG